MSSVKNRTMGMNLPRGESGDRIEAALHIMCEEDDRSMSKMLLRIIVKHIGTREPAFHEEVLERAPEYTQESSDGE
jgi:hypothetical protein